MSEPTQRSFDAATHQFSTEYYESLRGYIREELLRQNIAPYLGERLRIIDIGGGEGKDAIWFARQGHEVVLVEPSEEQLRLARRNFAAEDEEVRRRLSEPFQGTEDEALERYGANTFDFATSHVVVNYHQSEAAAQEHVSALLQLVKPLGKVSLATSGFAGMAAEIIHSGDLAKLEQLRRNQRVKNNLGYETIVYTPEQIADFIDKAGGEVLEWFGIRIASNTSTLKVTEISAKKLKEMLKIEAQLGSDETTKGMGKLLQFIVEKRD